MTRIQIYTVKLVLMSHQKTHCQKTSGAAVGSQNNCCIVSSLYARHQPDHVYREAPAAIEKTEYKVLYVGETVGWCVLTSVCTLSQDWGSAGKEKGMGEGLAKQLGLQLWQRSCIRAACY